MDRPGQLGQGLPWLVSLPVRLSEKLAPQRQEKQQQVTPPRARASQEMQQPLAVFQQRGLELDGELVSAPERPFAHLHPSRIFLHPPHQLEYPP